MGRMISLCAFLLGVTGGLSCSLRPPDSYVHIRGMPLQKYNACLEKNRGDAKEILDQLCRPYLEEKWEWVKKE